MPKPSKFSPEILERAVRMVYEVRESHDSQWAAIEAVSSKIGCTAQTLCNWIRKASSPTPRPILESKRWSEKFVSSSEPMRFSRSPALFSPRRTSPSFQPGRALPM
jgi:transposase-like protein